MAYIVLNSKFKPYSFQERIAPYQQYIEDFRTNQAMAAELEAKASVWDNMLQAQDTMAIKQRDEYLEDIRRASEAMSSEGLTANNRAAILKLKPRYASEIIPIEQAYANRKAIQEEARKLEAQGLTLERDMSTASLDNWMQNPTYDYGRSFNQKELVAQAARDFSALSKAAMSDPSVFNKILNNQYFQAINRTGFSKEEIQRGLRNNDGNVIRAIVDNIMASSGVGDWEDTPYNRQIQSNLRGAIENEAYNALGRTTTKELSNRNYISDAQRATLNKGKSALESDKYLGLNPFNLVSKSEMKTRKSTLDTYIQKGYINSKDYTLTKKGEEDLNKNVKGYQPLETFKRETDEFQKSIKGLLTQYKTTDVNKALQSYFKELDDYNAGVFKVNRDYAYRHRYADTESSQLQKDAVLTSLQNSEDIKILDWGNKGYQNSGETISKKDFTSDNYTIIAAVDKAADEKRGTINSVYEVRDNTTGDVFTIQAPTGSNPTVTSAITKALTKAREAEIKANNLKSEIDNLLREEQAKDPDATPQELWNAIPSNLKKDLNKEEALFKAHLNTYKTARGIALTNNSTFTQDYGR